MRHPGGYTGEDIDVLYDFVHSNDPALREACNESVRDGVLAEGFDRVSGDLNDFWKARDYTTQLGSFRAATLTAHASGRRLAADRPAANLSVWVVSLPWTGSRRITDDVITRTWGDPQNAGSLTASKPLAPGQVVELHLELQPDDQIVSAGERIGLMVFASDRDFTLWPEPGTTLTLDLDASTLELPVVGGVEAWTRATNG